MGLLAELSVLQAAGAQQAGMTTIHIMLGTCHLNRLQLCLQPRVSKQCLVGGGQGPFHTARCAFRLGLLESILGVLYPVAITNMVLVS